MNADVEADAGGRGEERGGEAFARAAATRRRLYSHQPESRPWQPHSPGCINLRD